MKKKKKRIIPKLHVFIAEFANPFAGIRAVTFVLWLNDSTL